MARLRTPYDKITAKECMKRFSDMAYSTSYIDIFQKGVEILYGPEFRVTIDLSKRMQFSCQICNRDMNSENAMAEHFRSGIHQKNLDKKGRLSDEVTYLARSSRYAKDSIHFRLITSQTAPIGLQFIEQYVGSKGTSYFKCFLCGAHGKMDTMYHHIIGNKHAEKYIKMSCILSDSILTSNERQQFRLFLKDSEGVNVDQIITIKGNAYYPFKWEMEGTPMKIGNCKIKKEIKYERSPSPGPSWKESPSLRSRRGWSTSSSRNSISPPRKRSKSKSKMQSKRQSRSPSDRWTRSPSRRRDRSPSRRRDRSPSRRRDRSPSRRRDRSPSRRRDRSPSRRRDRSPSRRRDRSPSRRRDRSPSRRRDRSPSRRRGRSPSRKRGRSPSRRSRSSSDSMERKRHRSKRRSRSSSGSMERKRHRSKRRSSSSSGSMERKRHRSRRNRHSSSSSSSSLSYSPKRYKQSDVKHEPSTSTHIKQEPCSSSSIKDFWSSTIIKEEPCSSSNIKSEPLLSEQRNDGGDITAYRNKSPPPLLRVKTDLFPSQSPMQVKDEPHSPSFDGNGLSLIEPMKIKKEKVDAFTQTSDMSLEEIMNGLNGLCLEYYSGGGKLQTAQDIRDTLEQMEIIAKCLRELCVMRLNDGDDKIPEHFNFLLHQREKRDKTIGYIQKWFTPTWNKNFGANC